MNISVVLVTMYYLLVPFDAGNGSIETTMALIDSSARQTGGIEECIKLRKEPVEVPPKHNDLLVVKMCTVFNRDNFEAQ